MPLILRAYEVLRGLADDGPCKFRGWVLFQMLSWFRFAIFVFVFIPSYFSITNCLSNIILVTRTISPVNDTNGQHYPLMETVTALSLCSKQH